MPRELRENKNDGEIRVEVMVLSWTDWENVMIYDICHPTENSKKWDKTKAKGAGDSKDLIWIKRMSHANVPGVYEWKCTLKSGKSIVFYLGKDSQLSRRIVTERLNEKRNTSSGFLEFTTLIMEHVKEEMGGGADECALFQCRTAAVGEVSLNTVERAILNRFDYVCNTIENEVTRIPAGCNCLNIKTAEVRFIEAAARAAEAVVVADLLAEETTFKAAADVLPPIPKKYTVEEIEELLIGLDEGVKNLVLGKLK